MPGVSAALAAPAAAGIPLMLRQLSVTVTIVDGNDDPEHGSPPDWEAIAKLGGTLVILTGRGRIRRIAARADRRRPARPTRRSPRSAPARGPSSASCAARSSRCRRRCRRPVTFVVGDVAALDLTADAAGEAALAHP